MRRLEPKAVCVSGYGHAIIHELQKGGAIGFVGYSLSNDPSRFGVALEISQLFGIYLSHGHGFPFSGGTVRPLR